MRYLHVVLCAVMMACSVAPEGGTDEAVDDGADKADGETELRVRVADTTVWLDRDLVRQDGRIVMKGRASRTVTDGFAFVMDDPYGELTHPTARTFQVAWGTSEARGLIEGVDLFFRLSFVHSSSRPDSLTVHAVARPKLSGFSGSGMSLASDVVPIMYGGRVVYRVSGRTTSKIFGVQAQLGEQSLTDLRTVDDTHFQIDLLDDHVIAGGTLQVTVNLADGRHTKQAKVVLRVSKLGLTSSDPYDVWPPPTCTDRMKQCLGALADGTLDLSSCGEARPVRACQGEVGAVVTDEVLAQAFQGIDGKLTQLGSDASALVGSDRKDQLLDGAHATCEHQLELMAGRWYPSQTARDAALEAAVQGGLDAVYARPLELVEPHAPAPGNAAATRQVVADALLAYIATLDFVHTEFGRPLELLTRQYRAQHVEALRFFREDSAPDPAGAGHVVYVGNWLDPLVEVTVDTATGQATSVLFEID